MSRISVIGIAGESVFLSVDRFGKTGETTVARSYHSELGGKGFNQAVAAARFGAEVAFLGAAHSEDVRRFTEIAERCGVRARFLGKDGRSPYGVITTDRNGDNRVCVYGGCELEAKDVAYFENEIKSSDVLLINNETPYSVNEKALEIAKANGIKVILNPAPTRKCEKDFLDKIDLFTPNEHETEGLNDYRNVIVTLGDKGCFIKETGELVDAERIRSVVDTTGAGDTFNGILAACIANGESLRSACEKANVGAAIKVSRRYILESIPRREEIEKFMEGRNG